MANGDANLRRVHQVFELVQERGRAYKSELSGSGFDEFIKGGHLLEYLCSDLG